MFLLWQSSLVLCSSAPWLNKRVKTQNPIFIIYYARTGGSTTYPIEIGIFEVFVTSNNSQPFVCQCKCRSRSILCPQNHHWWVLKSYYCWTLLDQNPPNQSNHDILSKFSIDNLNQFNAILWVPQHSQKQHYLFLRKCANNCHHGRSVHCLTH